MKNLLSRARVRWFLLAALWVILLTLGIGGYLQQSREAGLHRTFLDTLYLSLQLSTLQFSGGAVDLNWRLEVARFVAPAMAAGTILQTASYVFKE
ncbi:MAG: RyR protein, partial [Jatrophihabitantaceae bacterium]|nr:RyR protein [Jatrophihabitantaceae bacterium]